MDLLVLAKEPLPGQVKTRLTPPCTPAEAAAIAEAALRDTLRAASASSADRVVLGLDGRPGPWCPAGVEVVEQGTGDLAHRLERLWSHASGPALQIGMDTPQATTTLLDEALGRLRSADPRTGALLGPAADGGWWALGLATAVPGCFLGIEMSRADTGARQLERLRSLGRRPEALPELVDVDRWADATAVAAATPGSAFAAAVARTATRLRSSSTLVERLAVAG